MIKQIHCFGTSYTAGGGFEFDGKNYGRDNDYTKHLTHHYSNKYPDEELTQFNYSWPGQLQNLIGSDIQVNNRAKSGYGNDRMYRQIWNIIKKEDFDTTEHLFLLEFAGVGRTELWSNSLNDYIITNYNIGFHARNGEEFEYNGSANTYYYDTKEKIKLLDSLSDTLIEPFYKEFLSVKSEMNKMNMQNDFIVSYLKDRNINFMFTYPPDLSHWNFNNHKYLFDFKNTNPPNFIQYYTDRGLDIITETLGDCNDEHMGMGGAKIVSKIIYDKLLELKYIL